MSLPLQSHSTEVRNLYFVSFKLIFSTEYYKMEFDVHPPDNHRHCHSQLSQLVSFNNRLQTFRTNKKLCDVSITVGNTQFHAHKLILAASCDYFEAMFTSGFQESTCTDVELMVGTPEAFKVLLDYSYSGVLTIPTEICSCIELLKLSHYLRFNNVMKKCEVAICEAVSSQTTGLSSEEVVEFNNTANMYGLEKLERECKRYFCRYFSHMPMCSMSYDLMVDILSEISEDVRFQSEKEVRIQPKFSVCQRALLFKNTIASMSVGKISVKFSSRSPPLIQELVSHTPSLTPF